MSNEHTSKMNEIMTNQLALANKKMAELQAVQAQTDLAIHDLNRVITGIKRMLSALHLEAHPTIVKTDDHIDAAVEHAISEAVGNLTTDAAA